MNRQKTKVEKLVRSKLYDLIYYETLKEKPATAITSAQLARLAAGWRKGE